MMTLADGQKASLWTISGVSAGVGVISGFLGVGGGFVRMPAIYYVIGTSLAAAVGTSLFTGLLSGASGFTYGRAGVIDLGIVTALLLGSALGARIGSGATAYVNEDDVTIYFGIMLLIASIAVALGEAAAWLSMPVLDQISFVLLVGSALFVCATILYHGALAVRRSAARRRLRERRFRFLAVKSSPQSSPSIARAASSTSSWRFPFETTSPVESCRQRFPSISVAFPGLPNHEHAGDGVPRVARRFEMVPPVRPRRPSATRSVRRRTGAGR